MHQSATLLYQSPSNLKLEFVNMLLVLFAFSLNQTSPSKQLTIFRSSELQIPLSFTKVED